MIGSFSLGRFVDTDVWVVVALFVVGAASAMLRRRLPRTVVWPVCVLSISIAVALIVVWWWPTSSGAVQDTARACSVLALAWSCCGVVTLWLRGRSSGPGIDRAGLVGVVLGVALLLGVVAAVVQSVVLVMRMVYVATDVARGYPHVGAGDYGFGTEGLWSLGFLLAACLLGAVMTGDRRLGTGVLWSAIIMASWSCLLAPPLRAAATGGLERSGSTLLLVAAWALLLALAVAVTGWVEARLGRSVRAEVGRVAVPVAWPGLSPSVSVLALAIALLVCYHLAVPVNLSRGGFRAAVLIVSGSAAGAALGCFLLVRRSGQPALADAAMGLSSLGLCGLATLAVPAQPVLLAERYPMLFNAMIVGLALAAGLWTYVASSSPNAHGDVANGSAGVHFGGHARRFAFLSAALALILGVAMAIWPRWPAIPTMDDTVGRVTAGLAANLFLLLVMLWCSRRLHRLVFQVLTVLSVASAAGFLLVRMLPFTSRFG